MENWQEFTEDTIAALMEDGSDPDAEYTIEHHFYHEDFARLEKLAVEVFKLGYEVTDAEEVEFEDVSATVSKEISSIEANDFDDDTDTEEENEENQE